MRGALTLHRPSWRGASEIFWAAKYHEVSSDSITPSMTPCKAEITWVIPNLDTSLETGYWRDWGSESRYYTGDQRAGYRPVSGTRETQVCCACMCAFWEYKFSIAPKLNLGKGRNGHLTFRQQERKYLCPKATGFASSWLKLHAQPLCQFLQPFPFLFHNFF